MRVRKQKTDRQDAEHLLRLLVENRFPRIWVPSPENRDLRQLLWHRHRLVQMRTRVKNQLQAIALNEGLRRKKGLWSKPGRAQFETLPLAPWSGRRRQDLLELLDRLNPRIEELSAAIEQEAERRPEVQRLMTHRGVGPITALAFVLILGVPERFRCGKQVGSYLGLIPSEESSGGRQRLGHISKQGNTLLRFLLIESAHAVVRYEPTWRRQFLRLAMRRSRPIAKVAMARKLSVRLYWMWRKGWDYQQTLKFGSHVG
jgi:transposase